MYLFQLDELARKTIKNPVLVTPCDMLPVRVDLPFSAIINHSKSYEEGTHWIALHIDDHGTATYFDSYALKPHVKEVQQFIKLHSKKVIYNGQQLQRINSKVCGLYSLIFLYFMNNMCNSLEQFLSHFSLNLFLNDKIVESMFSKLIIKK